MGGCGLNVVMSVCERGGWRRSTVSVRVGPAGFEAGQIDKAASKAETRCRLGMNMNVRNGVDSPKPDTSFLFFGSGIVVSANSVPLSALRFISVVCSAAEAEAEAGGDFARKQEQRELKTFMRKKNVCFNRAGARFRVKFRLENKSSLGRAFPCLFRN